MTRLLWVALAAFIALASCTSMESAPTNSAGEGTPVYFISEQRADEIMKLAMVEVFPRLPIASVAAPYKGYTANMNFALDQHSVTLMMIPAKGSINGAVKAGFSFKVSQYGSIPITGSVKSGNLIKAIERMTAGVQQAPAL